MKNWKINTAIFLCAGFMFRIVFFNLFTNAPFNPRQTHASIKASFSPMKKRKMQFEAIDNLVAIEYSLAEIREEEYAHERNELESSPSVPIHLLYSSLAHQIGSNRKGIFPSDQHYSHFSSHRYLSLQVLRT